MMKSYTVKVEEDSETGEQILPLPDELLNEMGWVEGDELVLEETEIWEDHGSYAGLTMRKRYEDE